MTRSVDYLKTVPHFQRTFPHLIAELERGHVWCWDERGYTRELTDTHKTRIAQLEAGGPEYDLQVYAVIEATYVVDGTDTIELTHYLYTTDQDDDVTEYLPSLYYAYACVDNKSWQLTDWGSVVIKGSAGGGPRRCI